MSAIVAPCKGCTPENGGRHTACHDSCTRYAMYKLEKERERAWDRKHSFIDSDTEYQLRKQGAVWVDRAKNFRAGRGHSNG